MKAKYPSLKKHVILCAMWGLALISTRAGYLPAPAYQGPASHPDLSGFPVFNLNATNLAARADAPVIGEWTRVNGPGDTMILTGSRLSAYTGDAEGRDTSFILFGDGGAAYRGSAMIQRMDNMQVALTLPGGLPADQMYLLWAGNANGFGEPVGINQTEAWWVGPEHAVKGETVSIYGRNLALGNGVSHVYIEELDQWLTSVSANPYKADFVLPANMANGTYTLWAHNGSGREYGWAAPLKLIVVSPIDWSKGKTINVKNAPYNAKGDGAANDHSAIQAAIDAASSGDTVYLPAGTYLIGNNIRRMNGKRLLGDGMDRTTITTHSSFANATYNEMFFVDRSSNFEIRGLTASAGSYPKGKVFRGRDMLDGTFADVRFTQVGSSVSADLVDISNSQRIRFSSCEFYPRRNVFIGATRQVRFEQCDWYGIYDCNVLLSVWGSDELSVTGCSAQHYDASDPTDGSGWCQGRFVWGSGHGGVHRNLYFGGNRINNMHPRFDPRFSKYEQNGRMNTGEHVMFEWTATYYEGSPAEVQGNRLRLADATEDVSGCIAVVTAGEGVGQSRLVSSYDAATGWLDTDEPWRIVPNSGSTLAIGRYVNRMAVYGNFFDGDKRLMDPNNSGPLATNRTATTAVSVYGAFQDLVVSDNTIQQARHGIISWGFGYDHIHPNIMNNLQPNYFNLFQNNSIDSCFEGFGNTVSTFNTYSNSPGTVMAYNIVRNNRFSNVSHAVIGYNSPYPELMVGMTVYDHNQASQFAISVENSSNLRNQVWIGNRFEGGGSAAGIEFSAGQQPCLRGNTWTNFAQTYAGTTPGALLELPVRVATVGPGTTTLALPVNNAGTDPLNWTVSSDAAWLKVNQPSGVVADETAAGEIALAVDAAAVPSGTNAAIVTVSSGSQVKQATVVYASDRLQPPPPKSPPAAVIVSLSINGPLLVDEQSSASYTCIAGYSDGTSAPVTAQWSVNRSVAVIGSDGRLDAGDVAQDEQITITAAVDQFSAVQNVTVKYIPPFVTSLEISGPAAVNEQTTAQYACVAHYSDGSVLAVNPGWSVSGGAASISTTGRLTAADVTTDQVVTVSAAFGGRNGTLDVNIRYVPPTLTGITVVGAVALDEGTSVQLNCIGSYSDGTTAAVTPSWSENSAKAGITAGGVLSAGDVAADTAVTVTASLSGFSDTHSMIIRYVPPVLTGLAISGPSSLSEETDAQYTCVATYSDGSRLPVNPSWSENSSFASINASGLLSAANVAADQTVVVSASYGGKSKSISVTIQYVAPVVTAITVFGPQIVEEGNSAVYTCTATYSDGTSGSVVPSWSVNSSVGVIDASGRLSAGNVAADEPIVVSASLNGLTGTLGVTVKYVAPPVTLTGIRITGPSAIDELSSAAFSCTALYSDGSSKAVSPTWVTDSQIVSIDAAGTLSTGNFEADGTVTVSAAYQGKSDAVTVVVRAVGSQVVYPLSGFEGRHVRAELYDLAADAWHSLGEMDSPAELVVENVKTGQWYWVSILESNTTSGAWDEIHANWVNM